MADAKTTSSLEISEKIVRLVGRAIGEFGMIRADDRIAVGISGGKDSMCMLHALLALQKRAPIRFELQAFTIQQGKFTKGLGGVEERIRELDVPWELVEDAPSMELVRQGVVHGCDICSRYRRRAVYETARRLGCKVVALGHTADDFAEAMVRNLIFTGRVKPLPPVAISKKREFRIIRPLMYVRETWIRVQAEKSEFPIIPCLCSLKEGTRTALRQFMGDLSADNPHIYSNIIAAGVRYWQASSGEVQDSD